MIDEILRAVAEQLSINKFVETGTYEGESVAEVASWFAELDSSFGKIEKLIIDGARGMNPWNTYIAYPVFIESNKDSKYKIFSVDLEEPRVNRAKSLFASNPNIEITCSSSEKFLKDLIDTGEITVEDRILYFLDAHWNEYWPLHDELKQILRLPRFAIVIDDFAVPGRPDFGFETYQGKILDWNYIKSFFNRKETTVFYPIRSNRDCRGWVLIICGFSGDETASLRKLPLFSKTYRNKILKASLIRWIIVKAAHNRLIRWVYYHQKWRL